MSDNLTPDSSNSQVILNPENPDKSSGFYYTVLFQYYLGLWPSIGQPKSKGSYFRKYLIPCQCIRMLYSLYFQYRSMKMVGGDAIMVTEYTMTSVFYVMTSVKIITVYLFRNRFKNILQTLEDYNRCGVFDSKFRTDELKFCKKWTVFIFKNLGISVILVFMTSMIQMVPHAYANRMVPFRLYFPYDVTPSPIFDLTLITMFVLTTFDLIYIVFCDFLFIALLLNVATQFAVLRHDIENLQELSQTHLATKETNVSAQEIRETGEQFPHKQHDVASQSQTDHDSSNCPSVLENVGVIPRLIVVGGIFDEMFADMLDGERKVCEAKVVIVKEAKVKGDKKRDEFWRNEDLKEEVRLRLGECIKRHDSLIRMTLEIKYLFKYMLTLQVLVNVFLGVLAMYISTLAKSTDSKVMMITMVLIGGVLEFVLFCWFSENLNDQSGGVATAVYACSWLDMDQKTQLALKLVMLRSQRACVITAAGIPLSRKTFRAITKLAYYFHALLTRFYWGEKLLKSPE